MEQKNENSEDKKQSKREKHIVMARKLYELAQKGVGGEKDAAQRKFEEHLKKYKIHISEIDSSKNMRSFRVKSDDDRFILGNVILSVNPYAELIKLANFIKVSLDEEDFIEVVNRFKYFARLYKTEREMLQMSFMHKHKDFFQPDEYTRNKWREKYKINEDLQSAQIKVEKIENKLSKSDQDKLNKQLEAHVAKMKRMEAMSKTLLNAQYARRDKALPEKSTDNETETK